MRKLFLALTACLAFAAQPAFASFPVTDNTNGLEQAEIEKMNQSIEVMADSTINMDAENEAAFTSADSDREMWITVALWFFLGAFAAHRWYRKKPTGWNILFILTAGGCGVWAIVDLINILTGKF